MSLAETPIDTEAVGARAAELTTAAFESPIEAAAERCLDLLADPEWDRPAVLQRLRHSHAVAVPDLLAVIARAARILGDRWVADTCSFGDVTIGLHRLTLMLIDLEALPDPARGRLHGGNVLLVASPDDQHSFGLGTVAFALRRAGWDVAVDLSGDIDRIVARAGQGFDCIGLSVGHDRAVGSTVRLVERLRRTAGRATPALAVGGPMLQRAPDLAAAVGADFAAADGTAFARRLSDLRRARAV